MFTHKQGRDRKQQAIFDKHHEEIASILKHNPEGLTRSELIRKGPVKHRQTLQRHLSVFFALLQVKEIEHKLFWREQHDRLQVFEELIKKMLVELDNDPESKGLIEAYLADTVLMFVPKYSYDEKFFNVDYVLFRAPIVGMDSNAQAIWDCYRKRREELDKE